MNKSLSESHPTLWFELDRNGFPMDDDNSIWVFKKVQSCTVDVAEHEQLKLDFGLLSQSFDFQMSEVVRLKKELDDVRRELLRMDVDLIEQQSIGERRAMKRVKEAIERKIDFHSPYRPSLDTTNAQFGRRVLQEIYEELGLSEEEIQ